MIASIHSKLALADQATWRSSSFLNNTIITIIMRYILSFLILFIPGYLFAEGKPPVKVEQLSKTTKSWNGDALTTYGRGQPEVTILKITVQPGVELPWHTHPVVNAGYMLKGTLTVETKDGDVLVLHPGDTIVEVINKVHRGVNRGTDAVEILVFYAGLMSRPLTVKTE